jgi:hypothetical protein
MPRTTLPALVSIAVAAVALLSAPASSAEPPCFGRTPQADRVWQPVRGSDGVWYMAANNRDNVGRFFLNRPIWITGSGGTDRICTGGTNDEVLGDDGATRQSPQARDFINSGGGNDIINGYGGADVINGGPGRDTCYGGAGVDTFRNCETIRRDGVG